MMFPATNHRFARLGVNALLILCYIKPLYANQKAGGICHAQKAEYNYAGWWEYNTFGELICNYWQFLGSDERQRIERTLNIHGEPEMTDSTDEDPSEEYRVYEAPTQEHAEANEETSENEEVGEEIWEEDSRNTEESEEYR